MDGPRRLRRRPVGARRRGRTAGMDVKVREPEVYPIQVQGPKSQGHHADAVRRRRSTTSSTTGRSRPRSTGSPSSSAGPAGPARSATRSTCATRRAAATCGTASWRPASRTRSARSRRARRAASRPASSTTAPTSRSTTRPSTSWAWSDSSRRRTPTTSARRRSRRSASRASTASSSASRSMATRYPFELSRKCDALHDGEPVGTVTDLIWSPRLKKNIGYVWLPDRPRRARHPARDRGARWRPMAGPDRGDPVPRPEEGHPARLTHRCPDRPGTRPEVPLVTATTGATAPITPDELATVRREYRAASLLPKRAYHDPAIFDWEREHILRRDWIMVAREEDVAGARHLHPRRARRREHHRRPRPRRRAARLLQRLPPPRHGGRRGGVRQGRPLPVPVPRLDLRPRRHAHPRQAHRGPRRLQLRAVRPRADPRSRPGRASSS